VGAIISSLRIIKGELGGGGLKENRRKSKGRGRLKERSWIDRGDRRGSPTVPIIYNFGPNSKCEFHATKDLLKRPEYLHRDTI
jgi:hypothetical protein